MRGLLVAVLLAGGVAAADDAGWQRVAERDGVVVESRATSKPSVYELRATARSSLPPAAIMGVLWKHEEFPQFVPYLKRLDVLRDEGDVRLLYEQFHVPVLKDRDATVRVTRAFSPATGVYEMTSIATSDDGPPPRDDYVRIRESRGQWRLVPADGGGTAVTYTIRADVGGLAPAWIVRIAQRDVATRFVLAVLDRAQHQ